MNTVTYMATAILTALHDRKGVSATEYTLMVVGVAAAVLAGATVMGGDISSALKNIGNYISGQAGGL